MRITIWDLDWYHKHSTLPNHRAMKISSYHKQQGHYINFIEHKSDLGFDYDEMYIIKERGHTPFPPSRFIDRTDVKMIGEDFDFYDNHWETTPVIDMCRPDYRLYPDKEKDPYYNAHIVQFLHKGELLPVKQGFINEAEKHLKKTLVVDEGLWNIKKENMKKILTELKVYKNIDFLKPISLKYILSDKEITRKFLELHFYKGSILDFRNDYGNEFNEVKDIIDFIYNIKSKTEIRIKGIKVDAVIYDHWKDKENAVKDLERNLKIIDYAKQKKVRILLQTPEQRLETPYWVFFDIMDVWTKYSPRISYVESMLKSAMERTSLKWDEIVNNSLKWVTPRSKFLIYLMSHFPHIIAQYGLRQWGDEILNPNIIKWENVLKYRNYQERDEVLKNISETIINANAGG